MRNSSSSIISKVTHMVSTNMEAVRFAAWVAVVRKSMMVKCRRLIDDDCGDIYAMYNYMQSNHVVAVDTLFFQVQHWNLFMCVFIA